MGSTKLVELFYGTPWKFRRKNLSNIKSYFLTLLILLVLSDESYQLNGLFPKIEDLSSFTSVKTSSTCGLGNKLMTYCVSSVLNSSLTSCTQRSCLYSCCRTCGTATPSYIDLSKDAHKSKGVFISSKRHPDSKQFSDSFSFKDNGYLWYGSVSASSNFSFTAWINQENGNTGVLVHKDNVFTVAVKQFAVIFSYQTIESPSIVSIMEFKNVNIGQTTWHHLAVTVCGHDISIFIDGDLERSGRLSGILYNMKNTLKIGQDLKGQQYKGLMQDIKYYSKGLTNREVIEAKTGTLPDIPYTDCRCPESHPRLSPNNVFYCMRNGVSDGQLVQRLGEESYVPEYLVDGEAITYWLSEQVDKVTIELDLKYSLLQVFLVSVLFYSPPPKGMKIERSLDFGKTYIPWQYFALDCNRSFGMNDNGILPYPDSVNCIQLISPNTSWEAISFQPAEPGPENRPQRPFGVSGCEDFHCSPKLMQFVQATNVRLTLIDHALVTHPDHQYFGIRRIVVGGTCDCSGHGTSCKFDDKATPHPRYVCECDPRTFTHGRHCNMCLPLYNDKPYARGTVLNANPCKKCECNDHADNCTYSSKLDTDLLDRLKPGGGVCLDCKHNTRGRHCEQCKPLYYRPSGKPLNAADVCQPCHCFGPGVQSGKYECVKDKSVSGVVAGQCECKKYATGRQCTECKAGYFKLVLNDPDACSACNCNQAGTVNNGVSCHISSGQCACKPNVIGVKCTNCKVGYYGLNTYNPLGCSVCNCNSLGSNSFDSCHPLTGQCSCKDKYTGRACDRCKDGFYGPLCKVCFCKSAGVQTGSLTQCDANTGQCYCKSHVTGTDCGQCKPGYFGLSASLPTGCIACNCDNKGTVGNTGQCHQSTGVCVCKRLVAGRSCNLCQVGTYGLSNTKVDGCTKCDCNVKGTVSGDKTSKDELVCTATGQCSCLSNVEGKQCNSCVSGYYWNPSGLGCLPCGCSIAGSLSTLCPPNGQCQCKTGVGITGKRCDECLDGYYGYENGRCKVCACSSAGRVANRCNFIGQCTLCKKNVQGTKCDSCKAGTINLLANNPYGCSGAPLQQGPPRVTSKTSTSITLAWSPPDDPNGIILRYELKRNGLVVYVGSSLRYADQNLVPFTTYTYVVVAFTAAGSTNSVDTLTTQTTGDVPKGIKSPVISQIKERSVVASWKKPSNPNGVIQEYRLKMAAQDGMVSIVYSGLLLTTFVGGLRPFCVYSFNVTVCTDVGCIESDPVKISTRSAAPDFQPAPYANPLTGGTGVAITWDQPSQPNGIIQYYDLYMRSSPFTGSGNTVGLQLKPDHRSYLASNLQPYTEYEFRVVSHTAQVKGSTSSNWTRVRTTEGAPVGASKPSAISPSPTTMDVSWKPPFSSAGIILRYEVYRYEAASNYRTPILTSSTTGIVFKTQVLNLTSYTMYQFSVKACNGYSCTPHSSKVEARTRPGFPSGQSPPTGMALNSSVIGLFWLPPLVPNGPLPVKYVVERLLPPFNYPPPLVVKGVSFPGFGYYQFPGTVIPDSATNVIEFYFKTKYLDGLMLFASSSQQEDLIVIELRDGLPWFVFDTESGPAAFTVNSVTKRFNDDQWHLVAVSRDIRNGLILVDNYFIGMGSGLGNKNVIGQIVNVYIGGLPADFKIVRADSGNTTLKRLPFIGCMRDFKFKKIPLDFKSAIGKVHVPALTDHCPVLPLAGIYFKGRGYVTMDKGVFNGGSNFYLKFNLLTVYKNALLFYAHLRNGGYFIVYLKNSLLFIQYKTQTEHKIESLSLSHVCDNVPHDVVIESTAWKLSSIIDGVSKSVPTLPTDFTASSETYLGGVPEDNQKLRNQLKTLDISTSFGGCIKSLQIGAVVNFQHVITAHRNVHFNGCPSVSGVNSCTNPQEETVFNGVALKSASTALQAYTEYLYRVRSYQSGVFGYGDSEWVAIRSGEGAPTNIKKPVATQINAESAKFQWTSPQFPNGLLKRYYLRVYKMQDNRKWTQQSKLDVTDLSEVLVKPLLPATDYRVTVEAFTSAGGVESEPLRITTKATSPEGFSAPKVDRLPRAFNISWEPPSKPNGKILFYQVELNGKIYAGPTKNTSVYIDNLNVYTKYTIKLTVCGEVGCTAQTLDAYTGELPPQGVIAPQLKSYGSKRIRVQWSLPKSSNGIITKYEVYLGMNTSVDNLLLVFNATDVTNRTIINNLKPGQTYYVRIKAFTKAGGTLGDAARITTLESAPEGVLQPVITAINSTTLSINIFPPTIANGIITKYRLIQDGVKVFEGKTVPDPYIVSNLQPFSRHTFLVEVCTDKGCGSSDEVTSYTSHGKPEGGILLSIVDKRSRSFQAAWTAIAKPNGPITYHIVIKGDYYAQPGVDFKVVVKTVECFSGQSANLTHVCDGLIPKADYVVMMNGSNDAGFILSNEVKFTTLGDVPDGVSRPVVKFINSTSIYLGWGVPGRSNGAIEEYILYAHYPIDNIGTYSQVVLKNGTFFQFELDDLKPFTNYSFWLEARNEFGVTRSNKTVVQTLETAPGGIDPPKISFKGSRSIVVQISPPANPNGVIIHNIVYVNNTLTNVTDQSNVHVSGLTPFTFYSIHTSACTKVGCANSSDVVFRTIQDVPEGVSAPILLANGSRSVVVKWIEPETINGIIICYTIQRLQKGSASLPITLAKLTKASLWNSYNDVTVKPYTTYKYRVVAETSVGGTPSPYNEITTPQEAPEHVKTPTVTAISETSLSIEWEKPTKPNGIIRHYLVSVSSIPEVTVDLNVFNYTMTGLSSFVEYTVIVSACTVGGCKRSSPVKARTLSSAPKQQLPPTAEYTTNTSLKVRWDEPVLPNGPIKSYVLQHRTIESLITKIVTSPSAWSVIYEGKATVFDHTGLGIFSLHQYTVTCFTSEGNTTSFGSLNYRTGPGVPTAGPVVLATMVNHTSVQLSWTDPPLKNLKGVVKEYTVTYEKVGKAGLYNFGTVAGNQSNVVVNNLKPSTTYDFRVSLFNGAGSYDSIPSRTTTLAGIPEGFDKPIIYRIESTSLSISWAEPRTPNGDVMNYTIIANDHRMDSVKGDVTFHQQRNLKPYTSYVIKLQVCTTFMCILSEGSTAKTYAAAPSNLDTPTLKALTGTSIEIQWRTPREENGIMIGYQLYRRSTTSCPKKKTPVKKCTYIMCSIEKQLCGTQCYDPRVQTCCGETLHPKDPRKTCCDANFIVKSSPDDICCGGQFYPKQASYQCCYGYYRQILKRQVCCQGNNGVIVGIGNSCCGDIPYDANGDEICLCEGLYKKAGNTRQCCGKNVVSIAQKCCGDHVNGIAHAHDPDKMCCGTSYVAKDTSLCCVDAMERFQVYANMSATSQHKCCGTKRIPTTAHCCNENAFDNTSRICADRSTHTVTGCGEGHSCLLSQQATSYCDRCDFDRSKHVCSHVDGYFDPGQIEVNTGTCVSGYEQILTNTRNPSIFSYVDSGLLPHTKYEYYVVGLNLAGNVSSLVSSVNTLMGTPESLQPPVPTVISSSQVAVAWSPPLKPNGVITKYQLFRTKWSIKTEILVYTGLSQSHLDSDSLEPYTGYLYTLGVCIKLCANITAPSLVYTEESIPANVKPPVIIPVSSTSLRVNWSLPENPNGVIVKYNVTMLKDGVFVSVLPEKSLGEMKTILVTGLKPYTSYTFRVEACTKRGCTVGRNGSASTMQALPKGIGKPRVVVLSATRVDIEWSKPAIENGVIKYYLLHRNLSVVHNATSIRRFLDTTTQPATFYSYVIEAFNKAGSAKSLPATIITPAAPPRGIPSPTLTSLSSSAVNVTWSEPSVTNGVITRYSVLYQEIDGEISRLHGNGLLWSVVTGLKPYTFYYMRIEVCTKGGCGTGPRDIIRTNESSPFGQGPPTLEAKTSTMVEIKWLSPLTPNGEITEFQIERREGSTGLPFIIYIGSRNEYIDSQLKPYTFYQYRVRSRNTMGDTESTWKGIWTFEGSPAGLRLNQIEIVNSTTARFSWEVPSKPNGKIIEYSIRYRLFSLAGNKATEKCCYGAGVLSAIISGFQPAIRYEFQLVARTSAGKGYSAWVLAKLSESKPGDVPVLKANKNPFGSTNGTTLEIYWDEPEKSNGLITNYILQDQTSVLYEGVKRQALVRRLQPYTNYTFRLIVCNSADCLEGPFEVLTTAEVSPKGQLPPVLNFTTSLSVKLTWKPPLFPHGEIVNYQVIREQIKPQRSRRAETIVHTVSGSGELFFLDTDVKPFTTYRYKVRTINSQGSVESDWIIVTTPEAPPQGVSKINLTALIDTKILIEWRVPTIPNGIVLHYNVIRNGSRVDSTSTTSYTDTSQTLLPNNMYHYVVASCTSAGCTESDAAKIKTLEAAPQDMQPPTLVALASTSIKASWKEPTVTNGDVKKYRLFVNTETVFLFEGHAFEYIVKWLDVFTTYNFRVAACTSQGCAYSKYSTVTTLEDLPKGVQAPELFVVGSNAIDIQWLLPTKPNGIIKYYVIERVDSQGSTTQVYNGTDLRFTDRSVAAGMVYEYRLIAFNSAGSTPSISVISPRTNPSAPDKVSAPTLTTLTSSDILANWSPPGIPNGIVTGYYIIYDGKTINVGNVLQHTAKGLQPYTLYEFRIKACTSNDLSRCTTSLSSYVRTSEAPPKEQTPPYFESKHITSTTVKVFWHGPRNPNGVILHYELHRRLKNNNVSQIVYKGSDLSFIAASGLTATTTYEFKVVAFNKAGSTESKWTVVTTSEAKPSILPLAVDTDDISATSFSGSITAPKGSVEQYYVIVDDGDEERNVTNIDLVALTVTVTGLTPTTSYKVRVVACNSNGCGYSKTTLVTTKGKPPSGFDIMPIVWWKTTRAFGLKWPEPTSPNGAIVKYQVIMDHKCPQVANPDNCIAFDRKIPSLKERLFNITGLFPYTLYEVRVIAFNSFTFVESLTQKVRTYAEDPQYIGDFTLSLAEGTRNKVIIDWSKSFDLRSAFDRYSVHENKFLAYTGIDRNLSRSDLPAGAYTYRITVTTDVNGVKKTATTPVKSITVVSAGTPSTAASTDETPWYKTVWFLALCALAFVLLVFLIIVCCCRGYRRERTVYVRQREPLPSRGGSRIGMRSAVDFNENNGGLPANMRLSPIKRPIISFEHDTLSPNQSVRYNSSRDLLDKGDIKMNEAYEEDEDFIWDNSPNVTRDLDSGLYDDDAMSPTFEHTEDGFVASQQERILFPDTHL